MYTDLNISYPSSSFSSSFAQPYHQPYKDSIPDKAYTCNTRSLSHIHQGLLYKGYFLPLCYFS